MISILLTCAIQNDPIETPEIIQLQTRTTIRGEIHFPVYPHWNIHINGLERADGFEI